MTKRRVSLLLWLALAASCQPVATAEEAGKVHAGVATETFRLPSHVPLAGYSRRKGAPSTGVRDPVGVRALVVQDGDTTTALVSCDLLIVDERVFEAVRARVAALGLPQARGLLIAATHTHSGPGSYGKQFLEQLSMGHFDPAVFDAIVEAITRAILSAHAHLVPVGIAYQTAMTDGMVVNRVRPEGFADAGLTVCTVVAEESRTPLAVLVNFSAHPTTLGAWNTRRSADYPGVVMRAVERRFPGAVCLFFAGAVGDQAPVKQGRGDEATERVGHALAQRVVTLVETARPTTPRGVAALQEAMPLPPAQVRVGKMTLPAWLGRRLVDDDATLSIVQIGDVVFLGVPCDLFASLGQTLQREAIVRGLHPMVIGFASDYIGYCIPEPLYATHTYEAMMAFNGPTTGPLLVDRLTQMLDELVSERVSEDRLNNAMNRIATFSAFFLPTTPSLPHSLTAEAATVESHEGLPIVYLSGTPYELGRQHGQALRDEVRASVGHVLAYFRNYLKIPWVRKGLVNWWLDSAWRQEKPFVPADLLEELHGLSDGSGVSLRELSRMHAIPDRTYACSSLAAWGRATEGGRLIHVRNLDWNIEAGIQRHAVVFVVRPQGKRAFVSVGWAGFIGVLTGVNDAQLSIGQVGAETADATFHGEPMTFLMRRVLEQAGTLEEAEALMRGARRTVGVNYVVADAKVRRAMVLETTRRYVRTFAANDVKERAVSYARPMVDAVFRADTAVDPTIRRWQIASGGDPTRPGLEEPSGSAYAIRYLGQAAGLQATFGHLTPAEAIRLARATAPRSNIQSVVFAWPDLWVANAHETIPAAQTSYTHLDLNALLGAARR